MSSECSLRALSRPEYRENMDTDITQSGDGGGSLIAKCMPRGRCVNVSQYLTPGDHARLQAVLPCAQMQAGSMHSIAKYSIARRFPD